jgi:N-acetylmuramoyl-L-alanine amidase|tara:strand:+ start:181128 stop:181775 length:648 start_codon:yes stop_codon:yes gene_type:complete
MKKFIYIIIGLSLFLSLSGCGWIGLGDEPDIRDHKLPYWLELSARTTDELNMIVIHATELTDMKEAREYGERVLYDNGTGASGHYYIDRDGTIEQYVPDNRIANHTSGWNSRTLSIELVNLGRYPNWYHSDHQKMQETYPPAQIDALILLVKELKSRYPSIEFTQGHEDLDTRFMPSDNDPEIEVARKMDPGPYFPWAQFLEAVDLKKETPNKEE